MTETILIAFLLAKIKGYKLKPLFKAWQIYPVLFLSLIYVIINIWIFTDNYSIIKYSKHFEKLFLLSFLPLILYYEQYIPAIVGSLFIFIGTTLNKVAIFFNNGKMPGFPKLSYYTGYISKESYTMIDDLHIIGDSSTRLKFFTDIFDVGYSIMSIGDILIRLFVLIIIYFSIKASSKSDENKIAKFQQECL